MRVMCCWVSAYVAYGCIGRLMCYYMRLYRLDQHRHNLITLLFQSEKINQLYV